jgi:uncharacterized membrane protein
VYRDVGRMAEARAVEAVGYDMLVSDAKKSAFDWILEALSISALVFIIGTVAAHWTELPARALRHFGLSGRPDGWGNKNGMVVLPLTTIGLYILLTLASRSARNRYFQTAL